jgi:hypothetical protein
VIFLLVMLGRPKAGPEHPSSSPSADPGGCTAKIAGYDGARSAGWPGAPVAELVDAADSKSVARKGVLVRVRPGAPIKSID